MFLLKWSTKYTLPCKNNRLVRDQKLMGLILNNLEILWIAPI